MTKVVFLVVIFLALAVATSARIADFDEYWQRRQKEAQEEALDAYHHDPEEVNHHLNGEVHFSLDGNNSTRRQLHKYRGPCLATNPIDRCWRCDPNWSRHRKRLALCVLGFGRKTVGGRFGRIYVVTDASDNDLINPKPGTLRHAVIQSQPLWIVFAHDMIIRLNEELIMNSYKTIDGRGANVHIAYGAGITVQYVKHVIIHGLHIHDIKAGNGGQIRDSPMHFGFRSRSDGDGISIFGSSHVWVDHNSMSNCMDGLVDAVEGSTAITISNNHFTIIMSQHPTIISQGNRYIAPVEAYAKEVTKRDYAAESDWSKWTWRSEGDLLMNGAFFRQSGNPSKKHPYSKRDMISAKPGTFVTRLTRFAGALVCKWRRPC
ncbi:hypothetical protein QJS10_CPA07g00352 [Acorus calamus]|uniref:Pectate lyase n=1 Tax=Acorus calamus TaxID=4465 RepID=A0AAV9EIF3_ACOCL|nr:hypothetical protein QJS10_CPA07g00352 [Acorus calamus]